MGLLEKIPKRRELDSRENGASADVMSPRPLDHPIQGDDARFEGDQHCTDPAVGFFRRSNETSETPEFGLDVPFPPPPGLLPRKIPFPVSQ